MPGHDVAVNVVSEGHERMAVSMLAVVRPAHALRWREWREEQRERRGSRKVVGSCDARKLPRLREERRGQPLAIAIRPVTVTSLHDTWQENREEQQKKGKMGISTVMKT